MKRIITCLSFLTSLLCAHAELPAGYYDSLDGKQGEQLITALRNLAAGHRVITYNTKTWGAFEKTDVRLVKGRQAWWDMYSNNIVYLPEHDGLNIEHSVANSWWGGKKGSNEAYSDLFHLNPSDQNANNKKGNNPPGEVADARLLDNGLVRIGTPVAGQGGGAASVFEPADEYKGDFARAYFYVFTTYGSLDWLDQYAYIYDNSGKLQPWAAEMLMRWHRNDPVDSKELNRNEAIYSEQGNRNPFIDCPELAEYIWGENANQTFSASSVGTIAPSDRPEAPGFKDMRLTGVNTYSGRWWDGKKIEIDAPQGDLYISVDGGSYHPAQEYTLDPAENGRESHLISAYTSHEVNGHVLRSPISRLSMLAADPLETDYSAARWERIEDDDELDLTEGYYLITASTNLHVMSVNGGTSSTQFMESAGFVDFSDDLISQLPVDAAIVRFANVEGGKTRLMVCDIYGHYAGSWNNTAKNKMKLDPVTYTPGIAKINSDGTFSYAFDTYGSLQYNASQPRFLNYESNQKPVFLYKFKDLAGGWMGIDTPGEDVWGIGIDSEGISTDQSTKIYDLSGRPVDGKKLSRGIYIVVGPKGTRKIAF